MPSVANKRHTDVTSRGTVGGEPERKPIVPPRFTEAEVAVIYGSQTADVEEEGIESVAFAHARRAVVADIDAFRVQHAILYSGGQSQSEIGVVKHFAIGVDNSRACASSFPDGGEDDANERLPVLRRRLDLDVHAQSHDPRDF